MKKSHRLGAPPPIVIARTSNGLLLLLMLLLLSLHLLIKVSSLVPIVSYSNNHHHHHHYTRIMIMIASTTQKTLISRRRLYSSASCRLSSSLLSFSSSSTTASRKEINTNNNNHENQQQQQQHHHLQQEKNNNKKKKTNIAVIGGGLAGLSTVYHLLDKTIKINNNNNNNSNRNSADDDDDEMKTRIRKITIWDRSATVGTGGASAVAGGLIHPLSPSGKLVHWGMQGLDATRRLVNVSCLAVAKMQQQQHLPVVLRHEIIRLALTPQHVDQLLATEKAFSTNNNNKKDDKNDGNNTDNKDILSCRWMNAQEIAQRYNLLSSTTTITEHVTAANTNNNHKVDNKNDNNAESNSSTENTNNKNSNNNKFIRGGLLLSGGGCQVLHVPSYLQALWLACLDLGQENDIVVEWKQVIETNDNDKNNNNNSSSSSTNDDNNPAASTCNWSGRLADYDTIVLAAGNGMFGDLIPLPLDTIKKKDDENDGNNDDDDDDDDDDTAFNLPVNLVRGQSVEMDLPTLSFVPGVSDGQRPALLCGKYVSPLPPSRNGHARLLIGATHEFKINNPMSPDQVVSFLQDATAPMVPSAFWQKQRQKHDGNDDDDDDAHGSVDAGRLKITNGFRVQSQRGKFGRMPIVGRYPFNNIMDQDRGNNDASSRTSSTSSQNKYTSWFRQDQDVWIFTGLSSRGLLYHALYGDFLADAILANNEQVLWTKSPELKWWWPKKKKNK